MARILPLEQAFDPALDLLEAGDVVALPTETVYGLAADATNGEAVARIFEVKGRPRFNPLIVHVSDTDMARRIGVFDPVSTLLAGGFWPGPLTLVLPLAEGHGLSPLVTAGLDTVAIRMPRDFAREVVEELGRPIAAPSANTSGRITGTTAQAVDEDIGDRIELVCDGGPSLYGIESTIVKVTPNALRILRPGAVVGTEIEAALGIKVTHGGEAGIEAPGMTASHYAPDLMLRLDATEVEEGEALLAYGPTRAANAERAVAMLNLSEKEHMREAAANLYGHLKALDRSGARRIAVEPIPEDGLCVAINDRLRRAAAPRGGTS